MGAGYTGVVRRGHSLQDLGSSAAKLEEVTTPCATCGKPATVETYESNGQTHGLIKCPSYRYSRRFGAIKGCPPVRLTQQELEKLMPVPRKPRLTELEREEIRQGIAQTSLSVVRLNDLAGLSRNRLSAALNGAVGLEPEELARVRSVIRKRKETLTAEVDKEHEAARANAAQAQPVETVEEIEERAEELELPPTWGNVTPLETAPRSETPEQIYQTFRGFEHVCKKMHRLCPHLYQAAVRRAAEVAF